MKKLLTALFAIVIVSSSAAFACEQAKTCPAMKKTPEEIQSIRKSREAAFEKRLGLTEEQKIKARELRKQGHEKLKPIMDQIRDKHKEAEMVKMSRIAVQAQEEKLAVIDEELKVLEKQAHEIRKANMKEFEAILTKEQRKTLKNMKKEGRKKYQQRHR